MFKRTKFSACALLAMAGAIAPSAHAQDVQRVEVTGSSIKRIGSEGALPVQTITQQDIIRSGATSVTDLMQAMPVMQGFTSIGDSVGGGGGGVTTASIHDVGEEYTLVLLNGRRVAPSNSGTTIDLNSIPLAAIERIEVLTDGASALYGADAIAGVVNFILKRGASPLTLDAAIKQTEKGGGNKSSFSISKGFGDLDTSGFEVFVAASYDESKRLRGADREFAKTGLISGTANGLTYDFFNGSSRSVPPNVDVRGTAIGGLNAKGDPVNSISFSPYLKANGACPANHVKLGSQCFYDYTSSVEISPEIKRSALYASGKLKLGNSGWNAFADLAYTDVSTVARIAPYPAEFSLAKTHPYYTKYVLPYLSDTQAAVVSSVNVKYRLFDMANRTYDYNTKSTHLVTGVEGSVAGWDVSGAVTVSTQKQDENYVAGFPLASKFQAAINAQEFDPFPYAIGQMPAAQIEKLRATGYSGNYKTSDIKMTGFDVNAQRPLFKMAGGDATLSLGADSRTTSYKQTPNAAVAHSEILFDDDQPAFSMERSGYGAYGEMLFPFTKAFETQLAARYDSMGGVTDKLNNKKFGDTESATTFKLGAKWRLSSEVLLRASYGTGFRTASMLQIARPKTDFGVTSGQYDCPFSSSYDPLGYFAANYVCDNKLQKEVYQGGNPNLKPEKSNQWNIGLVVQPTENISAGLNIWSVEIKDAVSAVSEAQIFKEPAKYLSLFTTKFKASNGLTYVAMLDAPVNIGRLENQGLDWDLGYRAKTSFGRVDARIAGTHLIKSRYTEPGTDNVWATSLGKFGINDAVSFRDVITTSLTVAHANWEHMLRMNYRTGYTDQVKSEDDCTFANAAGDCVESALKVREHATFDWRSAWTVNKALTVTVSIENLFDVNPPLSLRSSGAGHQLGYDPRYASPMGRTFGLQAQYKF